MKTTTMIRLAVMALSACALAACSTTRPEEALRVPTPERYGAAAAPEQMPAADGVRQQLDRGARSVGSSRVDLQACKLEYSIVSPK